MGTAIGIAGLVAIGWAAAVLSSGPDRDGVTGLDWAPLAVPIVILGTGLIALAWLVARDGLRAEHHRLALRIALTALSAAPLALGVIVATRADGADTSPWTIWLALALPLLLLGAALLAAAWRGGRPRR